MENTNELIEKWVRVNKYSVSDTGKIMSHIGKTKLIKLKKHKTGYHVFNCYTGQGKYKTVYVHILVAQNFIENPLNKKTVNHKDGVKNNNNVSNLEWLTHQENIKHYHEVLKINKNA